MSVGAGYNDSTASWASAADMDTRKYWRTKLVLLAVPLVAVPVEAAAATAPEGGPTRSSVAGVPAPAETPDEPPFRRHSLGSSLIVLANVIPMEDSPDYYQLNYQYRLTRRDVLSLEAITWKYQAPLGIPYGSSWGDRTEDFPGFVRAFGLAFVYKRFIWRGAYAALHAANMHQTFRNQDGSKIQAGYQLFMTLRAGYHFDLFNDRVFVEPSIAMTSWPINTNLPESFQAQEDKWPSFFLGEAGLHFGVSF